VQGPFGLRLWPGCWSQEGDADHDPAAKKILEDTLIASGERLTATRAWLDGRLKALATSKE